jgi:hypothetical protein
VGYRRARDEVPSAADGWNALGEKGSRAKRALSFQAILVSSPVIFVVYIAFWPLVLLWLWVNQDENENERI